MILQFILNSQKRNLVIMVDEPWLLSLVHLFTGKSESGMHKHCCGILSTHFWNNIFFLIDLLQEGLIAFLLLELQVQSEMILNMSATAGFISS
jgi:hypothetical protein